MIKKSVFKTILLATFAFAAASCANSNVSREEAILNNFRPENLDSTKPRTIHRLDREIARYADLDSAQRAEMINRNRDILRGFGLIVGDSVDNRSVALWSTWPATTAFVPEVEKIYTDLAEEEAALGRMLSIAEYNDISVPATEFAAVTWGRPQSIIFADSTMYLALNHYLGALNKAYNGWPEYMRRLKSRDMIPVDIAEAIVATANPYQPDCDETVLSKLLYNGAVTVAKQAMVPDAPLYAILGFTPEQLADVQANEKVMWQRLIADNRLYSTDAELHHDLFALKAQTSTISPDAPGRAVRLIGYKIVMDYLSENPDSKLSDILSPKFYYNGQAVLKASGYPRQ